MTIPILPGIMPITSPARLRRVLELTGEDAPVRTRDRASRSSRPPEGQRDVGIAYAADLAREVVAGGAPGIHLYTFNHHDAVLAVLREAGILTTRPENRRPPR